MADGLEGEYLKSPKLYFLHTFRSFNLRFEFSKLAVLCEHIYKEAGINNDGAHIYEIYRKYEPIILEFFPSGFRPTS